MPYQKKFETKYEERDVWINQRTGEVAEFDQITKKVPRQGFEITYLSYFFDLFDQLGGKKYKVFKYIIENKSSENTLIITTEELAKKCKVGRNTVNETLKLLTKANLITRRTGAIMINPKLIHRGKDDREKYLLTKFETFEE
jgi:DNA-binding transcriptional regulator YhcF (GntR family)